MELSGPSVLALVLGNLPVLRNKAVSCPCQGTMLMQSNDPSWDNILPADLSRRPRGGKQLVLQVLQLMGEAER